VDLESLLEFALNWAFSLLIVGLTLKRQKKLVRNYPNLYLYKDEHLYNSSPLNIKGLSFAHKKLVPLLGLAKDRSYTNYQLTFQNTYPDAILCLQKRKHKKI
jgi:hypothetical protein